MLEIKEYF